MSDLLLALGALTVLLVPLGLAYLLIGRPKKRARARESISD